MGLTASLLLVIAQALPAPAAALTADQPPAALQRSVQTVRAENGGAVETQTGTVDAETTTLRFVGADKRVVEAQSGGEQRVLIELRERPALDRKKPGKADEAKKQREQLGRDLDALHARLQSKKPPKVRRHFDTLFSGMAATVDRKALAEIRRLPNVVAVYPDVEVRAQLAESVPMIGTHTVWTTYGVSGLGVKVAIIDTGIDYTHPDLGSCFGSGCKVMGGYDFVNDDTDPRDDHGHGTHVAGIVAANGAVVGVAPQAKLLAYKVLNQNGSGQTSDVIAALERAVLDGAKVANLSLGGPGDANDATSQAVDNATAAGMLSVIAAGNNGPTWQTIGSPGTARTALTVGAVDKSGVIASFSSRGYITDGDELVMKPEIVAPGVAINSTVPATGQLGNASRYAALDGTSMATPHVAGAAALLLHWKSTQTPADLKHRLAGSAQAGSENPFTEGAGLIDLVDAFALRVIPSATHLAMGVAAGASGVFTSQQTFSVRNATATAQTLSVAVDTASLPPGATLQPLTASPFALQAGQSANVTLKLTVDRAVTPEPPDPMIWSTSVGVTAGGRTTSLPVYFFRGSMLTLAFGEAPAYVFLTNPDLDLSRLIDHPGTPLLLLVPQGKWDILATYDGSPAPIVVREQVNVAGTLSLTLQPGEATRVVTVNYIDDQGQPLPTSYAAATLLVALKDPAPPHLVESAFIATWPGGDFRVSTLSSRYVFGVIGGGRDPGGSRMFSYSALRTGLSSNVILPVAGAPMRRLEQAGQATPGAPSNWLTPMNGVGVRLAWGAFGVLGGWGGPLSQTHYLQSFNAIDVPAIMLRQQSLSAETLSYQITDWMTGAYMRHDGGNTIAFDTSAFFNLINPARAPEAILQAAIERWDIDVRPNVLPLQFVNQPARIFAHNREMPPYWMTHTAGTIIWSFGAMQTAGIYRNGVLQQTVPIDVLYYGGVDVTPGAHELRSSSPYTIGGVSGSSRVVASFDTSRSDPNPPFVSAFRIEQNGVRTPRPFEPSGSPSTFVTFRATDDTSLGPVDLEWRQSGGSVWTKLPLTAVAGELRAPFQLEGAIDLRVTATDAAGNRFFEEWTPAAITIRAPATTPGSVTATRSGASSITVTWNPSSGTSPITGYRVVRLPGNATTTLPPTATTFVDSTGLVTGTTYLYRVHALAGNDSVSAPGQDLVAFVTWQDDPVVADVTRVRGIHVQQLRDSIDAVRVHLGMALAWPTTTAATGPVTAADFVALREHLNEVRTALQLPAMEYTLPVATGGVIRAVHVQDLRNAVK
jgi:subtilisin family serine protease